MKLNSVIPYWSKSKDPWEMDMILFPDKNPKSFTLQTRDIDVLQALLEHRFMTTNQVNKMFFNSKNFGPRWTQTRLKQLFDIGLVMRVRPRDNDPGTKPFVYALTSLGFKLLQKVGRIEKGDSSLFYSEEENLVEFSYIIHDVHLNDICLTIFEEAEKRELSFEWLPTKLCRQKVKMPDGKYKLIEPDAIFIFYVGMDQIVLHIEYERSADPRRFKQKLTRWKLYRGQQEWKKHFKSEPIICVIGERESWDTGGRKRRVVKSIQPLASIAYHDAFRKICFLPLDEVEDQTWNCLPYPDNSLSLWEHLGLK